MPNLWDKMPEAPSRSEELNPLTSPLLEQNLGRWAKVYFGNPPAKREQAVSELLEEIKRESGTDAVPPSRPYFATDPKFQRAVCPSCQRQNPPGHKFCSRCGLTLNPDQPVAMESPSVSRVLEPIHQASVNDVPWAHYSGSSALDDSDVPRSGGWKYLIIGAAIVAATFAYLQWPQGFQTGVAASPTKSAVPPSPPKGSLPVAALSSAATIVPESKAHESQIPSATGEVHDRTVVPAGLQPAIQKSSLLDAAPSHPPIPDQESGAMDLRLAQRYLGGSMGVRDPSEAAKLLWRAVSKQNAAAAILLSDLYLRGDGVPRSCDQARLLLVAAAKKGSPQAGQQLRSLESQGCR